LNFVPNSLRLGNAKHVWRFSRLAEFIIFNKYRDVAEKSIREYLEYFATRMPKSPETENIDRLVKWYQTDNETRKRYMTWQQEIDIAVYRERQRAKEIQKQADAEKARADRYEKMLRELGKL
jgi:hypothetical protein